MNKGKVENLRDKIDGNEVDLSLSNLTEVPVKELVSLALFLKFIMLFKPTSIKTSEVCFI